MVGSGKMYSGYRSYQYLERGRDYVSFKLAKEIGRVEPYTVPVSEAEEERVKRILSEHVVISLHDHTEVIPENVNEYPEYLRQGRVVIGYEGLSVSGLDAVFDFLMNGPCTDWDTVVHDLGMRLCDITHQDFVIKGEKVEDILEAHRTGKVAFIPCLEAGTLLGYTLDRVEVLYGLGIRLMGVVYNTANQFGCGQKEKSDAGLSYLGRKLVKRMNKIGMAIDASHAGDRTALDIIETSDKPVFLTHVGARALWESNVQMKPDEDGAFRVLRGSCRRRPCSLWSGYALWRPRGSTSGI